MNRLRRFPTKTFLLAAMSFAIAVAVLVPPRACAATDTVVADGPPLPTSAVPDGASTSTASQPMIVPNPDGTFTVRKEPSNGNLEDAKVNNGLVIPPQVVVPMVPALEKKY
jgi:hypothetical protein